MKQINVSEPVAKSVPEPIAETTIEVGERHENDVSHQLVGEVEMKEGSGNISDGDVMSNGTILTDSNAGDVDFDSDDDWSLTGSENEECVAADTVAHETATVSSYSHTSFPLYNDVNDVYYETITSILYIWYHSYCVSKPSGTQQITSITYFVNSSPYKDTELTSKLASSDVSTSFIIFTCIMICYTDRRWCCFQRSSDWWPPPTIY